MLLYLSVVFNNQKFKQKHQTMKSTPNAKQKQSSVFTLKNSSNLTIHQNSNNSNENSFLNLTKLDKSCKSRSFKKISVKLDISFQEQFFKEHIDSLQREVRKLFHGKNQQQVDFYKAEATEINKSQNLQNLIGFQANKLFSQKESLQFMTDLKTEEKLKQFLKQISEIFNKQISKQLAYITYLVWQKYIQVYSPFLSTNLIHQISVQYSKQLSLFLLKNNINNNIYQTIPKKIGSQYQRTQKQFRTFLKFYIQTVILIIQGYFNNPYFDQDYTDIEGNIEELLKNKDHKKQPSQCS